MTTTVTELAQDIGLARETDYYLMKDQLTEDELGLLYKVRKFAEADTLLEEVHETYRELGERHLAGRARISQGIYRHYAGNPQDGHRLIEEGLTRIDAQRDPKLAQAAPHQHIDAVFCQRGK